MKTKKLTRPFYFKFSDKTASGGVARLKFLPDFDRVPSTRQLVNTKELAQKYCEEVCRK
jgi:hypothetical protein